MGEAVCVSDYCVTPLNNGSGGRCSTCARDDPVLSEDLLMWDVVLIGRCFNELEASPSVAICVLCDCGSERRLGSVVASALLDFD